MVTAELATIDSTENAIKDAAPGKSIVAKSAGLGGAVTTAEMYQAPGIVSRPPKGARHVLVPLGSGRRTVVSVACKNYAVDVSVGEGETEIFSTSADGKTAKARILLGADGKIAAANEAEGLATLIADLIDAISDIVTTGSPTTHTVNAASTAALAQIKTRFAALLKEPS